jgi:hypothetical protein
MNQKKAKQLRREARCVEDIPEKDWYHKLEERRIDGVLKVVTGTVELSTCTRSVYKAFKKASLKGGKQ